MASDDHRFSEEKISVSPAEDYDPLQEENLPVVYDERSEPSDSPCSSMDMERGTLSDMLMYGVTPPNPRQRKLVKERDRNQKIKVAKRETSVTKTMNRSSRIKITGPNSEDEDEESNLHGTLEADPSEAAKRKKEASKNFKTSRAYDRDYKHSSSHLPSLESTTPKQLGSASLHQIHVDSPNRFLCLNSKPVSVETNERLGTSDPKNLSSQRRQHSYENLECPKERYAFHQLFSQLIGLHLKPKAEKENKSPFNRQLSVDQELWQNQWSDVIWLNLQAWHSNRTMQQEDNYLCKAREKAPDVLKQIMNFKVQKQTNYLSTNLKLNKQVSMLSFTSDSSGVYEDNDQNLQFPLETDTVPKLSPESQTPANFASRLAVIIAEQQDAVRQVRKLLQSLDSVHALYPSMKAVGKEHKQYNSEEFQFRLDVLMLWLNLTKGIGQKLQLMANVLGVDCIEDINWPWMNFESPTQTLQQLRDGTDVMTPNPIDSDLEDDEDDEEEGYSEVCTPPRPDNISKLSKLVTFDTDASSRSSSGATTPSASVSLLSPCDSSTPRHPFRPGVPHSNSYTNVDLSTRTSMYRYFVDRNLKKMGLGKLVNRLKDLLDGTLQRARQVLERPPKVRHSISIHDLLEEECPNLTALSSSPSLDGTPGMILPVYTDICCTDFKDMNLPSFKPTFLFLLRVPLDVIHECIRLRVEQQPDAEPSVHSVRQLIYECKEVLKGGVYLKQYYQQMVTAVMANDPTDNASLDLDIEEFENDLNKILKVYFDYMQSYISDLQKVTEMTKHLKNFLEEEWNFAKEVCPYIRGGEANAGNRFCLMTNSLLQSISDFLRDGMDEWMNQLLDCTLADSQDEQDSSTMSQLRRHASRTNERRHAITETCRHIRSHFLDGRERSSKALAFAKTLRKDLEIAADFNFTQSSADFLRKLEVTDHVQVLAPHHSPSCLMFVPAAIASDHQHILQLLDMTCGREDVSAPLGGTPLANSYLLLVKADTPAAIQNHKTDNTADSTADIGEEARQWTGRVHNVRPTAETTIALSHLEVESLLLVVLHSTQLSGQRQHFQQLMGDEVQLITEQTSCHQSIADSLAELKSSAMELRENLIEAIGEVDEKLTMDSHSDLDDREKPNIIKLYQDTLHQCYSFGFEYHKELMRLVSGDLRIKLAHQFVAFAEQWMTFVQNKCERGQGVKPRWATPGLEFLMHVCEVWVLAELTAQQFEDLKRQISKCVTHVIGDKQIGGPPGHRHRMSNPDVSGNQHKLYQRIQSCPDPDSRRQRAADSNSSRTSTSVSEPPTPFVHAGLSGSEPALVTHGAPVLHAGGGEQYEDGEDDEEEGGSRRRRSRTHSHNELGEGDDGGIVLDIHEEEDEEEEEDLLPIERVRRKVIRMEQHQTDVMFSNQQIGRVAKVSADTEYPISMRRVNFRWQRGMKIGQGQFGKVYTAVNIDSGDLLAMKQVEFQHNDHKAIKAIADELKTFEAINHPNLVRYYGVEVHRGEMLIFMEFCSAGTLEDYSKQGLTELLIRKYTHELLLAIDVLHANSIVHRDIKGANVFLTENGSLKLGDFGCSVKLKNHSTMPGEVHTMKGTIPFMAPEVINAGEIYQSGRATDIWSLGCVVVQMVTGKRPWHELDNVMVMFKVGMGGKPSVPPTFSSEGQDFLSHVHEIDPKVRWTASQLLDHPFVKVYDGEQQEQ